MIVLDHISLTLGDFSLHDVSLNVVKGEYLVIMGPSGAGKTVLLEIIAGLRTMDRGRIFLNGNDACDTAAEYRNIAIVYQDYSLFPHMTAFENIAFGLKLRRVGEAEIEKQIQSLLKEFGITYLRERFPSSMSGGEQQRVALARALAVKPEILLLDEPFAALDPHTREECMRMILAVQKSQNLTILQVSHVRDEAYVISDRVVLIIDGRVVQMGTAEEIFHNPRTPAVAKYAGIDNIFTGPVLRNDGIYTTVLIENTEMILKGSAQVGTTVTIFVTGEHIHLMKETDVPASIPLNRVSGTVSDILLMEHSVKIRIVGEVSLTTVIIKGDRHLPLPLVGEHLVAVFRAEDVHMIEDNA